MKQFLLLFACLSLFAETATKPSEELNTPQPAVEIIPDAVHKEANTAEINETPSSTVEKHHTPEIKKALPVKVALDEYVMPEIDLMEGIITSSRLNVRARPAVRYEVVGIFNRDEVILVEEKRDKWMFVVPPKKTNAWIPGRAVNSEGRIISDNVKIHAGPGVEYTKFGSAPKGAKVTIVQRRDSGWVKIQGERWMRAWVSADFVKLKEALPRINPEESNAKNTSEIEYAEGKIIKEDIKEAITDSHDYEARIAALKEAEAQLAEDRLTQQKKLDELAAKLSKLKSDNSEKTDSLNDLEKALARQHETIRRKDEKINELHNSTIDVKKQQLTSTQAMGILPDLDGKITTPPAKTAIIPELTDEQSAELEVAPGQEIIRGLIMPVQEDDHQVVDFALAVKIDKEYYPLCYVIGKIKNVHMLYNREVLLLGEKKRQDGWSRPIFHMAKYKLIRNKK